jgi:hypothetical protein
MEGSVGEIGSSVRHSNSSAKAVRRCHDKNALGKTDEAGRGKGHTGRDSAEEKRPRATSRKRAIR